MIQSLSTHVSRLFVFASVAIASLAINGCGGTPSSSSLQGDSAPQSIGRYLDPMPLPAVVKAAVADVSRLGREEGDFFGFQKVEAFALKSTSAKPALKKIVADVIKATRSHGDYSLAQFCQEGYDAEGRVLGFYDDVECATYLIGYQKSPRHAEVLRDLSEYHAPDSSEGLRMANALTSIKGFLSQTVGGENLEEISVSMNGLNVSEETVILINKSKGHVVLLKYDYGA